MPEESKKSAPVRQNIIETEPSESVISFEDIMNQHSKMTELEKKQENLKKKKERENKKKLDEKIKIGWDSGLL